MTVDKVLFVNVVTEYIDESQPPSEEFWWVAIEDHNEAIDEVRKASNSSNDTVINVIKEISNTGIGLQRGQVRRAI